MELCNRHQVPFHLPVDTQVGLHFGSFEVAPPHRNQVLFLSVEFDDKTLQGVFVGCAWSYRDAFERHGL